MTDQVPSGLPPDWAIAFRCRCGRYVAMVDYRSPSVATWLIWRFEQRYCEQCGTCLSASIGNRFFLEDMVHWARDKHHRRGIYFLGLKENEERERRVHEEHVATGGYVVDFYRPLEPVYIEGGH